MRAKRVGNIFKLNFREQGECKKFRKFCTFPPNSSKLRSDYLFSFQKRTNYLFPSISRSEYLFPQKCQAPPPLRIKWSSPWDPVNRFNHTSSMTIVTPTDCPMSVCKCCVIEVFSDVFMLPCCSLDFSVGVGAFVTGLSQISFFFSLETSAIDSLR